MSTEGFYKYMFMGLKQDLKFGFLKRRDFSQDVKRAQAIKETSVQFGFCEKIYVLEEKAERFLKRASTGKKGFDIFFVDPPYFSEEIMKILPMIGEKGLLNDSGVVIVEHFYVKRRLPELTGGLKMIRSYRYGDTILTLSRKKRDTEKIGGSCA